MLVSVGALKAAYYTEPSAYFEALAHANLVDIERSWVGRGTIEVTAKISAKGRRLLRRFSPEFLAQTLLDSGDALGAAWYVGGVNSIEALSEFLANSDDIIRRSATRRLNELINGPSVWEGDTFRKGPIRTATILHYLSPDPDETRVPILAGCPVVFDERVNIYKKR